MLSEKKRESVVVQTSTDLWRVFWAHLVQSRRCVYPLQAPVGAHVGGCSWGRGCFGNHSRLCKTFPGQKRAADCPFLGPGVSDGWV